MRARNPSLSSWPWRIVWWALLAAVLAPAGRAGAQPQDESDTAFMAAWGNPGTRDDGDASALAAHPLYPWLQAARLKNALLAQEPDAATRVDAFLALAGDAPHGRDLRRARLAQLAAAQNPQGFLALWRDSASNDALECLRFDMRRAGGDKTLAADVAKRWVAAEKPVPECAASFDWLKSQPVYRAELIEKRLRARLLDNDTVSAKPLVAELPEASRRRYALWLKWLGDPAGELPKLGKIVALTGLDDEGLADAWLRWAKNNAAAANALLPQVLAPGGLSLTERQILQRNTALALAWSRDPAALALFRQVPDNLLESRGHEWRIRAALWAGDWNLAFNWLSLLPENMASELRWRYWLARAMAESGQEEEARARFVALAKETDYHGLLAAWRVGRTWVPDDSPYPMTAEQRAALEGNAAFVRARSAWRLGLKPVASLEWREASDSLPAERRRSLIRAAAGMGWYDQAIVTASRVGQFGDISALFPRPYEQVVRAAAKQSSVPEIWLWGVMRRESAFKPDAVSPAGAYGLLQMLPGTAAMTAKAQGLPAPTGLQLMDPAINVPLGAAHLREVLDKSGGRWPMALAAYNAGFRAAQRWQPPAAMDADVWIENIPFNETRAYVQRILFHAAIYQWLGSERAVRADDWLAPVPAAPPAPSAVPDAAVPDAPAP